jgi:hypothetical protein
VNRRFSYQFRPDLSRPPNERREILTLIGSVPTFPKGLLDDCDKFSANQEILKIELMDHLRFFTSSLNRKETLPHFVAMAKGLLSDLKSKTLRRIRSTFADNKEIRNFHNFLTRSG